MEGGEYIFCKERPLPPPPLPPPHCAENVQIYIYTVYLYIQRGGPGIARAVAKPIPIHFILRQALDGEM